MLVKFTNMVDARKDDPIYINVDHITAVYEDVNEGGGVATKIYGQTGLVWSVQESLGEVIKTISAHKKSCSCQ